MIAWLLSIPAKIKAIALALLAGISAVAWAYYNGRADARAKQKAESDADYRNEIQRQQGLDVGVGATDAERIERLRDIADGRR